MIMQWIISSCVLILLVAALGKLLSRRVSARLRYALWLVVLVRLLIPVQLFAAPVGFVPQTKLPETMEQESIYILPTGRVPVEDAQDVGVYITEDGDVGVMTSMGYARLEDDGKTVVRYMDKVSPMEILGAVWVIGSAVMLLVLLISNVRFARRLKRARIPLEAGENKLPIYRVDTLPSPCLFGLLGPAIYVTGEALADETTLRHVLTHEETHFAHGDHIWSVLRSLALAIHWWNPLVWLAVALSRRDAELACDEKVLLRLGDAERKAYGETLLTLITAPAKPTDIFYCNTTMTGGMKAMKQRIQHIICKRKYLASLSVIAILVVFLMAACSFGGADENAVSREAEAVIKVMMTAPNEDLVLNEELYLNSRPTEEEKAAHQADRERVLQSWEKAVGKYFAEGAVSSCLGTSTINAFQTRSRDFQKEFAVVDLSQVVRNESYEDVAVTYTANGEEHRILVRLHIDADGKFCEVSYDLVETPGALDNILLYIIGIAEEPDEVVNSADLTDENTVSAEARRVIEVMMTAPNEDLIPKLMYGLGMSYTEEEKAAIQAESDRVIQNWENAIGDYFSEGLVMAGINTNTVNAFQTRWEAFGKEYAVVDMVRTFKDEKREEVDVTYTADGEEHHILVRLRINTDGKFYEVEFDYADESIEGYVNILSGPEEPDEVGQ